jgi:hypothetical protein
MLKIVFRLFVFVLFSCCASSCNKDTDRELECTIEIQNKDLREAITEYQEKMFCEFKKEIESGDSVYVGVWSRDVNDSIYRYYLSPIRGMLELPVVAPFDLCKVNGHHVLLSHAVLSMKIRLENRFSILSDDAYIKYSKILFPKEYGENHKGGILELYEPTDCYLTFLGDSLIDKTYKKGFPREKISVKLNDKEVYL